MTSIAWLTDIHLNFLDAAALQTFLGELGDCSADDNGDWSDADIEISLEGVVHAVGVNPTP